MAISNRFVIELSDSLKEFLVEVLPENLEVKGFIHSEYQKNDSFRFAEEK